MSHVCLYVHTTFFLSIYAASLLVTYLWALLASALKFISFLFLFTLVFITRVTAFGSPALSFILKLFSLISFYFTLSAFTNCFIFFSLCPSLDTSYLSASLCFLNYKLNFLLLSAGLIPLWHVLFLLFFLFYCSGCFFNLHVVVVVFCPL